MVKTYGVGTQNNHLNETIKSYIMCTQKDRLNWACKTNVRTEK